MVLTAASGYHGILYAPVSGPHLPQLALTLPLCTDLDLPSCPGARARIKKSGRAPRPGWAALVEGCGDVALRLQPDDTIHHRDWWASFAATFRRAPDRLVLDLRGCPVDCDDMVVWVLGAQAGPRWLSLDLRGTLVEMEGLVVLMAGGPWRGLSVSCELVLDERTVLPLPGASLECMCVRVGAVAWREPPRGWVAVGPEPGWWCPAGRPGLRLGPRRQPSSRAYCTSSGRR